MGKRIRISSIILAVIVMTVFSFNYRSEVKAAGFLDVERDYWYHDDVMNLVGMGVISGYEDNTFKPFNQIKVCEFIKLTVVASDIKIQETLGRFWYSKYVDAAINNEIIDYDYFDDYNRNITRGEMADILSRVLKLNASQDQELVESYIDRIVDYDSIKPEHKNSVLQVYTAGIITGYDDGRVLSDNLANRAEAATVIVRMVDEDRRKLPDPPVVVSAFHEPDYRINGIHVGMSKSDVIQTLGNPDDAYTSLAGYDMHVYHGDYSSLLFVEIKNQKVVGIMSNTDLASAYGFYIGGPEGDVHRLFDVTQYNSSMIYRDGQVNVEFYSEKNTLDGLFGVIIRDRDTVFNNNYSTQGVEGIERTVYHLTNAERVKIGQAPLMQSFQAYDAAYKHCLDMAVNGVSHEGSDGSKPKDRMNREGISALYYIENVAGGFQTGFDMHYGFYFSEPHRSNMLSDKAEYIGIASYYNENTKHKHYMAQNMFLPK